MLRRLLGASLLVAAFVGLPALSDAQAPKKGQAKDARPSIDSEKLHAGVFVGKLKTTPASDRTFTLTVEDKHLAPNGKAPRNNNSALNRVLQAQNRMQQAQNHMASARNPQQLRSAQQQYLSAQQQLTSALVALNNAGLRAVGPDGAPEGYKWVTNKQDVDFQAMEEVKVRTLVLPEEFDEKGNVKKYTKKELEELKGKDKTLKGYESSVEKLDMGQTVEVHLASAAKKPKADAEKKDADKVKDKDKDLDGEKKMQVKMVVILAEAPATTTERPRKKKN